MKNSEIHIERAAWDEIISMAQLIALFRKGKHLLLRRRDGAGWRVDSARKAVPPSSTSHNEGQPDRTGEPTD